MSVIRLSHPTGEIEGEITLNGSKSISNRVLIIRALCDQNFSIDKLSTSDDTSYLKRLLEEGGEDDVYNVGHAGTTFRFLTAYLTLQEGTQVLTGSSRMLERPIGPLVDALRAIGCSIDYVGAEGYPPLKIGSVSKDELKGEVHIDAGISSQYITALILIAPTLPKGLKIHLEGDMVSESYLQLTLGVVRDFGVSVSYSDQKVIIEHQAYQPKEYTIEADWSASSYHYSLVALAKKASLKLNGLFERSLQGDGAMPQIAAELGVQSAWNDDSWRLTKREVVGHFKYDFINQPDVAQTIGVICAAKKIENDFSGLKTLKIKETERIHAMNVELSKVDSSFTLAYNDEKEEEHYVVKPGVKFREVPRFDTYKDHRMAMAFAPLALLHPIEIAQPEVVSKSYPDFWQHLESLGFVIERVV